uniref:Thromboxane A2 receptor n=1 Tax=Maylandia zebra TaxID=106582 RepID=A0A3P9C872_9CICH
MTTCHLNQTCGQPNSSVPPPMSNSGLAISCFTMLFGTISNLAALSILAKSRGRFCRQSKAPFLLLTVALLLADLGGHVILGSFALYLHMNHQYTMKLCDVFGTNMVFFGLCPLLFGCVMAVERCVAITKPFCRFNMITVAHVVRVVLFLSALALVLAILPLLKVGTYTIQYPCTWCFLRVTSPCFAADTYLALIFSCLGLTALTLSLFSNIMSVASLVHARMKTPNEVMAQLVVITVVSCVCWSPFLVSAQSPGTSAQKLIYVALRIASWNQILDPWVYILLRKTVLFRVCGQRWTLTRTYPAPSQQYWQYPHLRPSACCKTNNNNDRAYEM